MDILFIMYTQFHGSWSPGFPLRPWLNLNPSMISNHIHYKVWEEITYPFPNFNGCANEVWEWISNLISPSLDMWLKLIQVSKGGYWRQKEHLQSRYKLSYPQNSGFSTRRVQSLYSECYFLVFVNVDFVIPISLRMSLTWFAFCCLLNNDRIFQRS